MSFKSFACVAALTALIATPALAVPTLQWVDNGGSATLQIVPSGVGSIAPEILVSSLDVDLTNAVVADAVTFDTANPGANPITSTTTTGLYLDLANDQLFASFGSVVLASTTPVDFLTIDYTGTGTVNASGLVAELAVNYDGLTEDLSIGAPQLPGDANEDGTVDLLDLDILGTNFGLTPATWSQGDFNDDNIVDLLDLDILGSNFGATASSAAVPEPAALALALLAGAAVLTRRV